MKNYFFVLIFISCFCNSYAQTNEFIPPKWRLNLSGGLGYLIAGTTADENAMINLGFDEQKVKKLYNDFKNGIQGSADLHYFLNENIGLGMKYAFFTTNGSMKQTVGNSNLTLGIKETDNIHFVGPSLQFWSFIGDSWWAYSLTVSGGYAYLKGNSELSAYNNVNFDLLQAQAEGDTFGIFGGIGLEYWLNDRIALGLDMGCFLLIFNKLKVKTDLKNNQALEDSVNNESNNYSRLDFSLSLKIYF